MWIEKYFFPQQFYKDSLKRSVLKNKQECLWLVKLKCYIEASTAINKIIQLVKTTCE